MQESTLLGNFWKMLGQLTLQVVSSSPSHAEHPMNNNIEHIGKAIIQKCKSLGHTTEASQDAKKHQFVMIDHFGLNTLFLTITPDDKCSF